MHGAKTYNCLSSVTSDIIVGGSTGHREDQGASTDMRLMVEDETTNREVIMEDVYQRVWVWDEDKWVDGLVIDTRASKNERMLMTSPTK